MFMKLNVFLFIFILTIRKYDCHVINKGEKQTRNFYIDFDNNTFIKDSQPFKYVSGSIHSYRIPKELWEDRLTRLRAAGLNAIQTYVFWNEHEPYPGVFDFEGQNDIFSFIELAQKIGFLVILRPGPYICGEHEFGGFPWWLLSNNTDNLVLRSNEKTYMNAVTNWMNELLPRMKPYLYKNGGPIITVQIENEYGSYYTCDEDYKIQLRDLFIKNLGDDVVYFTTDPYHLIILQCGKIPNVYSTVDFGTNVDPSVPFKMQRKFSPKGPLVNSEFYPGWLDVWGGPHQTVNISAILKSFNIMMQMNASVNFYMFHGGTNYGFSNGAVPPYLPQPTSYDYDAPVTEAGDITDKYLAIRNSISNYIPIPSINIPSNSTKVAYGNVQMNYHIPLVDAILELSSKCVDSKYPLTFEQLGQGYGFILYKTTLDDPNVDGKILSIEGIRDRGYVQIGDSSIGVVYRLVPRKLKINLKNNKNTTLYIIVENMARVNFGNDLLDRKGIIYNVTLDGKILSNWTACLTNNFIPYYQQNVTKISSKYDIISKYLNKDRYLTDDKLKNIDFKVPAIYIGKFMSASNSSVDTFLKMEKFTKGIALIRSNDKLTNLGRYWPNDGPQVTLYTPGAFTSPQSLNYVSLIEFEGSSCQISSNCQIEFVDKPIIDSI